tara:strand:+ start:152 stop:328 length:177 start_codon:yes stop_codon:yes gene_type:complete
MTEGQKAIEMLNEIALNELKREGKTNTGYFKMNLDEWSDESILELSSLLHDVFVDRNS